MRPLTNLRKRFTECVWIRPEGGVLSTDLSSFQKSKVIGSTKNPVRAGPALPGPPRERWGTLRGYTFTKSLDSSFFGLRPNVPSPSPRTAVGQWTVVGELREGGKVNNFSSFDPGIYVTKLVIINDSTMRELKKIVNPKIELTHLNNSKIRL